MKGVWCRVQDIVRVLDDGSWFRVGKLRLVRCLDGEVRDFAGLRVKGQGCRVQGVWSRDCCL